MSYAVREWLKRILGYGAVAASGYVGSKVGDPDVGSWVGSGVAIIGGLILNKALPFIVPTQAKLAEHVLSKPLPPGK